MLALGHLSGRAAESALAPFAGLPVRLALPVFTHERDFQALRTTVKHLLRAGYTRWEASDLATLHLLRQAGVSDVSSDWTLYAFNRAAIAELADLGVVRAVASPENSQENLAFLANSPLPFEFLEQQSTPLFISLTPPSTGGSRRDRSSHLPQRLPLHHLPPRRPLDHHARRAPPLHAAPRHLPPPRPQLGLGLRNSDGCQNGLRYRSVSASRCPAN